MTALSRSRTTPTAGRVHYGLLQKGPNGRALCRWCRRECRLSMQTFCSPDCVHEHKLRSNPGYLRDCLFARDRGVCAVCRTDTVAVLAELRRLAPKARKRAVDALGYAAHRVKIGSLWDADHIRPVAQGGGECGLENLTTLCVACHRRKTAAQARARQQA